MDIRKLLKIARQIWGPKIWETGDAFGLQGIIVAMGVVYGDICRWERDKNARKDRPEEELEKELGNLIFSTIRWCDDLGFDPEVCIERAIQCQREYVRRTYPNFSQRMRPDR